jgi:hypothetical protein
MRTTASRIMAIAQKMTPERLDTLLLRVMALTEPATVRRLLRRCRRGRRTVLAS